MGFGIFFEKTGFIICEKYLDTAKKIFTDECDVSSITIGGIIDLIDLSTGEILDSNV